MHKRSTFWAQTCFASTVLMLLSLFAFSQGKQVSGKVTDAETKTPIPGVSVQVKNTSTGTISKPDGTFSLTAPENAVLVFSFIGYDSKEVPANAASNVVLKPSVKSLQDVVVVGYGTQKRNEVTTAVATVKAESFNQGGARSPLDLVQGKVAGLTVTRPSGNNPNSGASIQIRGITSMTGDMAPLVVIDGIPGGNLDLLQQDDIASFDVLKDGAAAAIYGTRGNNGVILITTKKGKAGDPQFTYSTYLQREAVAKKPGILSAADYVKIAGETNNQGANVNMYDMLLNKDNLSHYHNFAASGGTANSNYRASIYYNDANGIALQNGRQQYGGRVNVNQTGLQGRLSLQLNLATNFNKANMNGGRGGDFEQAVQRNPTAPVTDANGKYIETNGFNNYNPLARLLQEQNWRDQKTSSGDLRLTLEPINDLKISAFGAIVSNDWNDREYRSRDSRSSIQDYQGGGYAKKANYTAKDRTFETTIDYTKKVSDHTFNILGGYSYQYSTYETYDMDNNGFLTDAFEDWNINAGNATNDVKLPRPSLNSHKEDNTLVAFFGRLNYNYQQKYMLQAILRHEGSSRFGANYKWGNFPAISAGWVISKEAFMQDVNLVNNLKLRVGYGITGNQGIPSYQSLITMSTGGAYLQYGKWIQTYGPNKNPNPNLRWEKKKELNVGLDWSILNNRIGGAIDVYSRRTDDLLFNYTAQLPPYIVESMYTNVGSLSNRGVEVVLNTVPVRTKDFTWNSDVTFNFQKNKVISFSNDVYKATQQFYGDLPSPGNLGQAIRVVEGGPLGTFYGYRYAGLNDDGQWLLYKKDGSKVLASEVNEDDKAVLGTGIPKYMASWGNTFRYKNWDLTLFFRGKFGFKILNLQELYFGNKKWAPNNMLDYVLGRDAKLNDNPVYSDYYLEKGDFVKLDNITLGYNFKLKTKYIRNLRLYATGRNIATITKYSGLDPELEDTALDSGIDSRGFYPRTRSYTIGLNIGF
ncbi:TonB-linked SusC/RagA family outer membrane protein [Chitinophaga terrae (ex Kim and Jung 2007)]|uniref:SusC/RagA family TonB-linked outer membrane protein n=1 Tax=Chitinophaga terrae (ex Kim and Jung 2007) TaxID=408074 RepID=UPI0027867293|nr:TonB-dependent receptor [Chitinophaga terrae (ex Kim and Jung 2007)]MDQ0105896.1 TonB-linked SusC/RagA family outer membrane protein [Chitinophaga terrae (ex Kim and Jung 2007)]